MAQADWFAVPKLMPVKPVFDWKAILPVGIMFIVTAVETVGDISGCNRRRNGQRSNRQRTFRRRYLKTVLALLLQHYLEFFRIPRSARM